MKFSLITLACLVMCFNSFSQINHIKMMVGDSEKDVRAYFDSLNSLKHNSAYKISKDVSKDGDLILSVDFALNDQDFYTCIRILALFRRVDSSEICTRMLIEGDVKNAQSNLSYIKDNFKYISENNWEHELWNGSPLVILATFERKGGEYPYYIINFTLKNKE